MNQKIWEDVSKENSAQRKRSHEMLALIKEQVILVTTEKVSRKLYRVAARWPLLQRCIRGSVRSIVIVRNIVKKPS